MKLPRPRRPPRRSRATAADRIAVAPRSARAPLVEPAPAKINLTLEIRGRRGDGYHELQSLVVFARVGDRLRLVPGKTLALDLRGPLAAALGGAGENLVLKAARELAARIEGLTLGRFELWKRLPVAAGIGGGSSDAAAALRLMARANALGLDDPRLAEAACATGADVPVCMQARARLVRGIGEDLSDPLDLPKLSAVLVNPAIALATKNVFAVFSSRPRSNNAGRHAGSAGIGRRRDPPAPAASSWHSCACATTIWSKPRSRWRRSSPKCWRSCARCPNASSRGCRAPARLALQSSGPRAPRSRPRERCVRRIRAGGSARRCWAEMQSRLSSAAECRNPRSPTARPSSAHPGTARARPWRWRRNAARA